jgi:ABC-type anion transport system duplicated permease subunit
MAKKYMVWFIAIALCVSIAAAFFYIRNSGAAELSDDCILVQNIGQVLGWA